MNNNNPLFDYLFNTPQQIKRKVFVSFHHENDQPWYDYFVKKFSNQYEVFMDKSIGETKVRSSNPEYIDRAIREDYIKGSSITVVLCGAETYKRKYVDWEINSTLLNEHALLGIALSSASKTQEGKIHVPNRLYQNIQTGYAHFIEWTEDFNQLNKHIELALNMSKRKDLIDNTLEKMTRNQT